MVVEALERSGSGKFHEHTTNLSSSDRTEIGLGQGRRLLKATHHLRDIRSREHAEARVAAAELRLAGPIRPRKEDPISARQDELARRSVKRNLDDLLSLYRSCKLLFFPLPYVLKLAP